MLCRKAATGTALTITLILGLNMLVMNPSAGEVSAWYDGNPLSEAYPNYGIHDIIANMSLFMMKQEYPEKAKFIDYWYLHGGSDSLVPSFKEDRTIPGPNDNFLAYLDDAPVGDAENYFINNRKGWEDTDAPAEVQKWANRSIQNLTAWMLDGMPNGSKAHHRAVYNIGILSHYVGDMSQFGHTDYSKWDQATHPTYDPYDATFQLYYERYVWEDETMNQLIDDFGTRKFNIPDVPDAYELHQRTADVARFTNGRGMPPVQMEDRDSQMITVGYNYQVMLESFRANWEGDKRYRGTRGFDEGLWNLTVENLVSAAENLTTFYVAIYDKAWDNFLSLSPDLEVVSYTYTPQEVIAGDLVTVTATIRNNGPKDSGQFNCGLFVKGAVLKDDPLEDRYLDLKPLFVPAYSERNVTFFNFKTGTVPLNVSIRADHLTQIYEADEENNFLNFSITPIPEHHESSMELVGSYPSIRRDTTKYLMFDIVNPGNRFDLFTVNASTVSRGIEIHPQEGPIGVSRESRETAWIELVTDNDAPLGRVDMIIDAVGLNSSSSLPISFDLIERTNDPVPVVTGDRWAWVGQPVTLSAASSTDPDGDALSFLWNIQDQGNRTGPDVTFNYTKSGSYIVLLTVHDGNVSVVETLTVDVFPIPPQNLSASVFTQGVSTITVRWKAWPSGGLENYWVMAEALEGQGVRSERGPYFLRFGPGNTSGTLGAFYPDTEVKLTVGVEAQRFGNHSMDVMTGRTNTGGGYGSAMTLKIEGKYLYLRYRPWLEDVGEREPEIVVEKLFKGEFVPIGAPRENISKTETIDIIRFPVGSNFGSYRATCTYFWSEGISPFSVSNTTHIPNRPPTVDLVTTSPIKEQDQNGTANVFLQFMINDPDDQITLDVDWGDGQTETLSPFYNGTNNIFHNYTELGEYTIRIIAWDWSGDSVRINTTIKVVPYHYNISTEKGPSLLLTIALGIVLAIVIIAILAFAINTGMKMARKESVIDFDREKGKNKMALKAGTGTDFDQRRVLQIPKESIMRSEAPPSPKDDVPVSAGGGIPGPGLIKGQIVFDDEE
ncbi:MAG: PKD domain-containing protein [Candidatus Thermoplasmatota archaeon]|nr:PKD domain-containing protein [Candidatus Thermoplasmatota archaeon]